MQKPTIEKTFLYNKKLHRNSLHYSQAQSSFLISVTVDVPTAPIISAPIDPKPIVGTPPPTLLADPKAVLLVVPPKPANCPPPLIETKPPLNAFGFGVGLPSSNPPPNGTLTGAVKQNLQLKPPPIAGPTAATSITYLLPLKHGDSNV